MAGRESFWEQKRSTAQRDSLPLVFGTGSDSTLEYDGNDTVLTVNARGSSAYSYGLKIDCDNDFFVGGAATKSYLVQISGDRPSGSAATGDSNDALLKLSGNNYAANDANFIFRGLNASINNRSAGTLGSMEHSFGTQGKSGGTCPSIKGLMVTAENYGTCATTFGGIDVLLKNEAAVATTEFGIRLRNENNSVVDAVGSAVLVTDTGANTGWDVGINLSGASIVVADMQMSAVDAGSLPCIIASGSATDDAGIVTQVGLDSTVADGSLYISVVDGAGSLWQKQNDVWVVNAAT